MSLMSGIGDSLESLRAHDTSYVDVAGYDQVASDHKVTIDRHRTVRIDPDTIVNLPLVFQMRELLFCQGFKLTARQAVSIARFPAAVAWLVSLHVDLQVLLALDVLLDAQL